MSGDLNRVLIDPRKEVHRAHGPLAKLFRRILWDLEITPKKMNTMIINYLDDPRNAISNTGKTRSTERGNIVKDLSKTEMTWKNFVKAIRILSPIRARLKIEMDWPGNKTSHHTLTLIDENGRMGDNDPGLNTPLRERGMPE